MSMVSTSFHSAVGAVLSISKNFETRVRQEERQLAAGKAKAWCNSLSHTGQIYTLTAPEIQVLIDTLSE